MGPTTLPITHAFGGAIQRRILELSQAQARAGHHVVVFSIPSAGIVARQAGMRIVEVRCRLRRPLRDIEFLLRAVRALRSFAPDVVHFHSMPLGGVLTLSVPASKFLSFDFFEFRGSRSVLGRRLYRAALRRFDRLLPVSEYCRRESSAYLGIGVEAMSVIHNGVNTERLRPDAEARERRRRVLGLGDALTVLYVGRVCEQKGSDILAAAFPLVAADVPGARLVVVGPVAEFGEDREDSMVDALRKVGANYEGPVSDELLPEIYNSCDLFVMPTRTQEMFGMAAAEAQACAKAVVASRQGGLPEVLSAGAILVEPGDAKALASAVSRVLRDPEVRRTMEQAARRNVERFDWSVIVESLDEIYELFGRGLKADRAT